MTLSTSVDELARTLCRDLELTLDRARELADAVHKLADYGPQDAGEWAKHAAAAAARLTLAEPTTRARTREELARVIEEGAATAHLVDFPRREALHRVLRTSIIQFLDSYELVPFDAQVLVADQLVQALVDASSRSHPRT